jgi:hypothetical protein
VEAGQTTWTNPAREHKRESVSKTRLRDNENDINVKQRNKTKIDQFNSFSERVESILKSFF